MNLERGLDRVERMLMLCIEADDRERRERRKQSRKQTETANMGIDAPIQVSDRLDKMAARADEWVRAQRIAQAQRNEEMDKLRIAQDRIDRQIDKLQAGQASLQESQAKLEQVMAELAEEHAATERSLKAFLDGLRKGQNGKSSS